MVKKKGAKKIRKKSAKKRVITKKKVSGKSSVSRKDFEIFKFGVERLKELKKELDSLDTRGFNKEQQTIRAKLKNVSEIPNIERDIKVLKLKIKKKYHPRRKARKTKLIREDIKTIKDDIPQLKREIKKLSRDINIKKGQLDPGVGVLVDADFNDFLNHIKMSLSKRVKAKEKGVDNVLKFDLQKREQKFKEKYTNLIREFNNKKKLEQELEKKRLNEKIGKEKEILQRDKRNLQRDKRNLQKDKEKFSFQKELEEEKFKEGVKKKARELQKAKQNFIFQKQEERRKIKEQFEKILKEERKKRKEISEIENKTNALKKLKNSFEKQKELEKKRLSERVGEEKEQIRERRKELIKKIKKAELSLQKLRQDFTQKGLERKKIKERLSLHKTKQNLERKKINKNKGRVRSWMRQAIKRGYQRKDVEEILKKRCNISKKGELSSYLKIYAEEKELMA